MHFDFDNDDHAIRDALRRWGRERLAPHYQARELADRLEPALLLEMGENGFLGVDLPQAWGGLGASAVTAGVVIEETAYHDFNVSYAQLLGSLMGGIVAEHASASVAEPTVRAICAGRALVALGLTEPGGGSDAANLSLRAERIDGGYRLTGEKASASFAGYADQCVVLARTGEQATGARGITALLVDLDAAGVSRQPYADLGTRPVGRGSLFFDGVEVPEARRLGREGEGFSQVMRGFDYSRALIALQCLGAARASMDETWAFVSERRAFGRPIAKFQGVTEPLAVFETQIEAARLLCYKALWLKDRGLPHTSEAAMVKWWAPKLACDAIQQCLITQGHMGYTMELPHQQRLRDVLGLQIGDGTAQIQKMIVARERIGRVAVPYVD